MGEKISFIDLFGTELELEDEYAREQLSNESAARAEDVAVLEARMDTFTALPNGSTAGDAELTDIRVGYNGETYNNAGAAVRNATKNNNTYIQNLATYLAKNGRTITPSIFNETIRRTPDNELSTEETYLVIVTVPTSGTYTLKAGVTGNASQMQDTITTRYFEANNPEVVFPYSPSVNNVHFWSLNCPDWELTLVQKLPDYYSRAGETLHNYELVLTDNSVYTDFNDFPIGSSIVLTTSATALLRNAPPSGSMYGHQGAQNKQTIGTCITYSTSNKGTGATSYCKSQVYITWNNPTENENPTKGRHHYYPAICYRSQIVSTGVWSDWTRLTQNGVLHATNAIIDENYYNLTVDDLNHVPPNTIYQIDLNCQNLGHNPFPGHSGMVATISFSESYLHGSLQLAACEWGNSAKLFFRYGFTSGESFYWTPWEQVTSTTVEEPNS